MCKIDSLYCGHISLKHQRTYRAASGEKLFSFGYVLGEDGGMETESASFFVFGVSQGNRIIFSEVANDLVGEIQLKLAGFEKKGNEVMIWGEMYPYFSGDGYGEFRLCVKEKKTSYLFQYRREGH